MMAAPFGTMVARDVFDRFQRIADEVVAPAAELNDRDATWPEDAMRAIQEDGLAGLVVPEQHGGLGGGLQDLAHACRILSEQSGSMGLCFGMHSVGTAVIASKATEDHAERYLEPIAAGEHITTLALSEPGTGSHFYIPETELAPDGDDYVLNGTKCFVTNGGHADSYVVSTQAAGEDALAGSFSCVLVPNEGAGIRWDAPWEGLGMRGNSSRTVHLKDARIPKADRLGQEGDQIWYVFQVVAPYFLTAMAGTYIGIAHRALGEATRHLKEREYSDSSSLAQIDVLQHRVGRLWSRTQSTQQLIDWACRQGDAGEPDAVPAIMAAKAEVGHTVVDIVNECMTLVGGSAYRDGSVLDRLLRDARAAHVMSPTTDMLYTWAGRALLDQPLLEQ